MNAPTEAKEIPLDQIEPVFRRARDKAGFEGLKASLKSTGLKQPIQVKDMGRRNAEGIRYKLICGQGRTEAARALGWETIPAIVVEVTDEQFVGRFFNENVNRASLPWAAKGRIIRDEIKAGKSLADVCRDLNISDNLGQRYLNVINNAANEIADEIEHMGMNVAERLTKLPAQGQKFVMNVARETQQPVVALVKKAEKLEAKGKGWTQAALSKAVRGVGEVVEKQRKHIKLLRRDYAIGPQNLLRLLKNRAFHDALKAARVNLEPIANLE